MNIFTQILIAVVALEHFFFMYFEMFAWTTMGKKMFRSLPEHLFQSTKAMAANQGLYNGFLAAGLVWTFFIEQPDWQRNIAVFFLSCVIIAGLYGAFTVSRKIFYAQALPAIIAFLVLLFHS
jgi:putative membrane protein